MTQHDDDLHDDFARFHLDISSLFDDDDDDTGTIVEDDEDDPGADYYLGLEFEDDDQAALDTQPLESPTTFRYCDLCGGDGYIVSRRETPPDPELPADWGTVYSAKFSKCPRCNPTFRYCDLCGGTLTIAVGITDCPACGSVGHIDCPRCDGTGCVFVEAPCPSCTTPEAASS